MKEPVARPAKVQRRTAEPTPEHQSLLSKTGGYDADFVATPIEPSRGRLGSLVPVRGNSIDPNPAQLYPPNGWKVGDHFEQRMTRWSIDEDTVDDVVDNGTAYSDANYEGATVYHKDGIAVIYDGWKLQTCYHGKVKTRWTKI